MVDLAKIRKDAGVTQVEIAERLQQTQGAVSQAERRDDPKLSTLVEYLQALGAQVQLTITVGEKTYGYDLTEGENR